MTKRQWIGLAVIIALLVVSGTAVFAQMTTPTVVPPPVFTDGRINSSTNLGGLAIYCVDQNSNTHVTTFDNGGITVWGIGDQKYIYLTASQLHGDVEIPQTPSVMEMQMTQTAAAPMQPATPQPAGGTVEVTAAVTGETPILLAHAFTPNGEIGFFKISGEQFALQGHDQNGNFFTYTWNGCSQGIVDYTLPPYLPKLAATPNVEFPAFATPEITPAG